MPYRIQKHDETGPWWAISLDFGQLADGQTGFDVMRPLNLGQPISDTQRAAFPTRAIVSNLKPPGDNNVPPDLIVSAEGPLLYLSPAARLILEEFEPGAHRFVDFEVIQDSDEPSDGIIDRGIYHCLHLTALLDCIDYEETHWDRGKGEKNAYQHMLADGHGMVLKTDAIAGHHIWRGSDNERMALFQHFISDELLAAFDAAGLTRNWYGEPCDAETLVATE